MKKLLLVLLLLITSNLFSQEAYKYYEVPSGTTNELKDLKSLYFNSTYFYVCGNNGTLLKIYNADSVLRVVQSNTTTNLNGIFGYISSSSLYPYYIFGDNGLILRNNNNSNWFPQISGYTNNLYSGISMRPGTALYSYRYIAVGSNGLILKRNYYPLSDSNWTQIQSGTTNNLKSISIFSSYSEKAWIAGANGTILKTIDTGNTWTKLISGTTNNLNYVLFKTLDTGFVVGDGGIILKTINGGTSWIQKSSNTYSNLNCIAYYNDSTLFIAGNKVILISTNKGENWAIDTSAPNYNLNSVNFVYSGYYQKYIPFFVGEAGKVFKRTLDTSYHPNINVLLDGNNISAFFLKTGILDQDRRTTNKSGFEWPKGSGKTAVFTAGLCIGAFVNNQLKQASASYVGEYSPGYCEHGVCKTNNNFKYYKVSRGDNAQNSWDWANWGLMVPSGAPFIDVNNNGIYEPAIDTPGVKNASQTIFYCMTDADYQSHTAGEGFGGGTLPLGAEVHLTAWVYDSPGLQDVQFINYSIINKSDSIWKKTYMALYSDPDLGDPSDDYTGCDTNLKLSFCYNSDNDDNVYGSSPPAVGFVQLTSPTNHSITPNKNLGMTSSNSPYKYVMCEGEPNGEPYPAYLMLAGFKRDSTSWLDPMHSPYLKTKFTYTGDPESNTGWTRLKGYITNCGHDTTGNIIAPAPAGDMKMYFSSGAEDFNMAPGDTQRFVVAQLIARGSSNLNSVTVLKSLCSRVRSFYETNFPFVINPVPVVEYPTSFMLDQNYPNPFNSSTKIKFHIPKINGSVTSTVHVSLVVYDMLGREVKNLFNGDLSARDYELVFEGKNYASGMYFYRLKAGDYTSVKRMVLVK
jgi:hypothetical protein